jgi:signal transduction histidine kinase
MRVVSALLRSARDRPDGSIVHNPPETCVAVSVTVTDGIEVRVRDNGKGLAAEEIERLFDRYYRGAGAGDKPEGSGLGLAIAKQAVSMHQGSIKAQSVPGQGMEIIITLPEA